MDEIKEPKDLESGLLYFRGVGKVQAAKLAKILRATGKSKLSIQELRQELIKLTSTNPSVWDNLGIITQADIFHNPLRFIPRPMIEYIESVFKDKLKFRFDFAGSYSRGRPYSGDIDMVLAKDTIPELAGAPSPGDTKAFEKWIHQHIPRGFQDWFSSHIPESSGLRIMTPISTGEFITTTFIELDLRVFLPIAKSSGKHPEYIGYYKWNKSNKVFIKLDIFMTMKRSYIFSLLYARGNGVFNISMRLLAKKRNMILNQYGLFNEKGLVLPPEADEKDIFKAIGLEYIELKDRNYE